MKLARIAPLGIIGFVFIEAVALTPALAQSSPPVVAVECQKVLRADGTEAVVCPEGAVVKKTPSSEEKIHSTEPSGGNNHNN